MSEYDELFDAVQKKFNVREVVVLLYYDHSGHFANEDGDHDKALICFSNFDTLTVEKIEEASLEKDTLGEFWIE